MDLNTEQDYHVSSESIYWVDCEMCGVLAGHRRFDTPEEAESQAKRQGFKAIHTPEDGTINFCRRCKK